MKKPPLKAHVQKPGPQKPDISGLELEEKRVQINKILDDAQDALKALGCPYFLAALDRDTRDPDGGKVFVNSELTGPDMSVIMQHAFPSNKDLIFLGIHVGNEIQRRNKEANIQFREKKRKPAKYHKIDCPKCGGHKMHETDKTIREPYTKDNQIAALECRKCGQLIVKPAEK